MMMTIKTMIATLLIGAVSLQTDGSAIPMWEFLTREEKMTCLHRIFEKQAKEFCEKSLVYDCFAKIMIGGLQNLVHLDDFVLDTLDPYQRNAKTEIWHALVGNKKIKNRVDNRINPLDNNNVDSDTSDSDNSHFTDESASMDDYLNPSYEESYPSGPYIIRVYPDGRPVPTKSRKLKPYDDDLDELIYYHRSPITEIPTNHG